MLKSEARATISNRITGERVAAELIVVEVEVNSKILYHH